jgi:hypothetical protein
MNLQAEIDYAKSVNWAKEICKISDRICREREHEPDIMIQILNGDIFAQAQDEFAKKKKLGKYDSMNMPIEVNL